VDLAYDDSSKSDLIVEWRVGRGDFNCLLELSTSEFGANDYDQGALE
jgi:hypothetical protein